MSQIENGGNSEIWEPQIEITEPVDVFLSTNEPGDHHMVDEGSTHPGYPTTKREGDLPWTEPQVIQTSNSTPPVIIESNY